MSDSDADVDNAVRPHGNNGSRDVRESKRVSKHESNTKTTVTHDPDTGAQTTVTTTETTEVEEEYDPDGQLDDLSPAKALSDALREERRRQKEAFDALIQENVRLEREVTRLGEQVQELSAQNNVKVIELNVEKGKNKDLKEEIIALQKEIRLGGHGILLNGSTEENLRNTDYTENEQKIRDLQFRLKRLAEDDKAKDCRIEELEEKVRHEELVAAELGKHVDADTAREARQRVEDMPAEEKLRRSERPTNVVVHTKAAVTDSKVCTIS